MRILGCFLYSANSYASFLARIPIHASGIAAGASESLAYSGQNDWAFDDFAIGADGTAYVATEAGNLVTRIVLHGRAVVIAVSVNGTEIASPASVQLGRTEQMPAIPVGHRPVMLPGAVMVRTWVEEKSEGRKLFIKGVVEDGAGNVYAEGESLFLELGMEAKPKERL